MWKCCAVAAESGNAVFLYGSSQETLAALQTRLREAFPALVIAGAVPPPYRELTPDEDASAVATINDSGATLIFVSLGCPKQELWMTAHRERIHAVMIGVGAAFDYHAGTLTRAPVWAGRIGLEWLYRLAAEPRRLWKRYLITNTLFIIGSARQLIFRPSATRHTDNLSQH
jgi:N-acetylglucosaminyldiphosphoundecaprenol N-acetyl-beta-D-mannosaminyltransferase